MSFSLVSAPFPMARLNGIFIFRVTTTCSGEAFRPSQRDRRADEDRKS